MLNMENILKKYDRLRHLIKDGDIILFHGTGFVARTIQKCDKSYYNHVGIVFEKCGALYIVDANANGVQCDRLSFRINKYRKGGDFTIIKPLNTNSQIQEELTKLLKRSDKKWIRYDFYNGIKELLNRRFGWNLKIQLDERHDICSDFVSSYQINLKLVNEDFLKLRIAFPEDTIRYKTDQVLVIN
jgi:hypothetical protein